MPRTLDRRHHEHRRPVHRADGRRAAPPVHLPGDDASTTRRWTTHFAECQDPDVDDVDLPSHSSARITMNERLRTCSTASTRSATPGCSASAPSPICANASPAAFSPAGGILLRRLDARVLCPRRRPEEGPPTDFIAKRVIGQSEQHRLFGDAAANGPSVSLRSRGASEPGKSSTSPRSPVAGLRPRRSRRGRRLSLVFGREHGLPGRR